MGIFNRIKDNQNKNIVEEITNDKNKENIELTTENSENTLNKHDEKLDNGSNEDMGVEEEFRNDIASKVRDRLDDSSIEHTREEYIENAIEHTVNYFTVSTPTILNSYDRGLIKKEDVKRYVERYIKSSINSSKYGKPNKNDIEYIYNAFAKFVWGYDIIEALIEDRNISDINITDYDKINIKVRGERKLSDIKFRNPESYRRFVEHTAMKNRKSISDINAIQKFTDRNASKDFILRFNISTEITTSVGHSYISIRKVPKFKYGFEELIRNRMLSQKQSEYLIQRIKEGHSGIICGKGGSGKTILLNELLEAFDKNMRIDVIQDNEELFCDKDKHPDIMFHRTVEPQGEAKIRYDLDALGRNGLLEDLDGFIVGEVRGVEAAHLGHMAYTAHQVWCTVHAESIYDAHYKIADYARPLTGEEPERYIRKIKSMDTVIFMHKFKIIDIGIVDGIDNKGNLVIHKINL